MRTQETGGVILLFGGAADPPRGVHLGGLQTAFHAVEAMRRQLSAELGADGIRVVTLRTSGIAESISDPSLRERITRSIVDASLLGRVPTLEDVGNAAAFAASDRARMVTAAHIDISAGTFMDMRPGSALHGALGRHLRLGRGRLRRLAVPPAG